MKKLLVALIVAALALPAFGQTLRPTQIRGVTSDTVSGTVGLVLSTSPAITTSLTSPSASFTLLATPTTVTAFGAATTATLGATTGTMTLRNATIAVTNALTVGTTLGVTGTSTLGVVDSGALTVTGIVTVNQNSATNVSILTNANATNGYGLAIHAGGTSSTRYALMVRNPSASQNWFEIKSETGQVGNALFSPDGTLSMTVAAGAVTIPGTLGVTGTSTLASVSATTTGSADLSLYGYNSHASYAGVGLLTLNTTRAANSAFNLILAQANSVTQFSVTGVGVGYFAGTLASGALTVTGTFSATGAISTSLTTDATSISTGASLNSGGASVTKALWVGGLTTLQGGVTVTRNAADVTGTSSYNTAEEGYGLYTSGGNATKYAFRVDDWATTNILTVTTAKVAVVGEITTTTTIKTGGYTVAGLPAAGTAGRRAYVTNQITVCAATGAAILGGGALVCPVFDNGVAWVGG